MQASQHALDRGPDRVGVPARNPRRVAERCGETRRFHLSLVTQPRENLTERDRVEPALAGRGHEDVGRRAPFPRLLGPQTLRDQKTRHLTDRLPRPHHQRQIISHKPHRQPPPELPPKPLCTTHSEAPATRPPHHPTPPPPPPPPPRP